MEGRRRKEREADAQGLAYGGSITPGVCVWRWVARIQEEWVSQVLGVGVGWGSDTKALPPAPTSNPGP